jgi:hypothetical protein
MWYNLTLMGLFLFAGCCEAFCPQLRHLMKSQVSACVSRKPITQAWVPFVPKVIDLSQGPLVTDSGITKQQYEAFFSQIESASYCGFKWELAENEVRIYDMADVPHESASRAFENVFLKEAMRGGWDDSIKFTGGAKLFNPDPTNSNWEPDCSYLPVGRKGPKGSFDESIPYPTMILEVAASENDYHVKRKAVQYFAPNTAIQIVLVLLIRPELQGADRLQVLMYQRGQKNNPCWECAFDDPLCTQAGDSNFRLQLPVRLLFDQANIPSALAGQNYVELDLFKWKQVYSLA